MSNALYLIPKPKNEPINSYAPDTPERKALQTQLEAYNSEIFDIPMIINGEEISPFALQEAVTQQKRQLVSILGDDIDPAMLDDDRLQPRALDSLIQRTLLLQKSSALNLVASEAQVGKSITAIEAFQLNGEFSADA